MGKESEPKDSRGNFFSLPREILRRVPVNYEVIGQENVEEARRLLEEGKIIAAVLDHRSFADIATGAVMTVKEGIDDLAKNAHIVVKITYTEKFPTKQLLRNFKTIPVVPHTIKEDPRREETNQRAIEAAQNLPDGSILAITPEGTRVRGQFMQQARTGASDFWHGAGERYVLPIAIEGTENQWPRGTLGTLKYLGALGFTRHKAKFIFGRPTPVANLDVAAERFSQGVDGETKKLQVDLVMLLIAMLHNEHGDPKYSQGYYSELIARLDRSPISRALRKLGRIGLAKKEIPQEV